MRYTQITLRSYAKINLGLHILGKRDDGYHEIRTVYQTISLFDRIKIDLLRKQRTEFRCDHRGVAASDNLVLKAIRLVQERYGIKEGFSVHLEKRIPVGAGLGGGSSNAAVTLLGICRLLNLEFSSSELIELAGLLGSDVPFFLVGGKAIGIGRGSEVYPLVEGAKKLVLLVVPTDSVSTPDAFSRISFQLTMRIGKSMIPVFCSRYWDTLCDEKILENDFESVVFCDFPELKRLKEALLRSGAVGAGLTGSGSVVFGLFTQRTKLREAQVRVNSERFQFIPTETLSRNRYHESIVESLR